MKFTKRRQNLGLPLTKQTLPSCLGWFNLMWQYTFLMYYWINMNLI